MKIILQTLNQNVKNKFLEVVIDEFSSNVIFQLEYICIYKAHLKNISILT